MLFGLKKEILSHTTTQVNVEDVMASDINQPQKANTVRFYLHGIPEVAQFKAIESGVVVPRAGVGRECTGSWCLAEAAGPEHQFCRMKTFWRYGA